MSWNPKDTCATCRWYGVWINKEKYNLATVATDEDGYLVNGECHRYPRTERRNASGYCGEFVPRLSRVEMLEPEIPDAEPF
jgi:hypothetical protein